LPDQHGIQGRHALRLYAERMVAIGMVAPHVEPPQGVRDAAFDLVNRLIEAHNGPRAHALHAILLGYIALGLICGVAIGVGLIAPVVLHS
jgi:hypothetical protein